MKKKPSLTRRDALKAGAVALGGLLLPSCSTPLPPTYGKILRMSDNLTYVAQRTLLPGQALAKEYSYSDISSFPALGTVDPGDSSKEYYSEEYEKLRKGGFADWKIKIEGSVANPGYYSLADLQLFPKQSHITRHTCEEGWTAIAQWTGVSLGTVLQSVGILPSARYVNYYSYDGWADSIDLMDAFHPQTILAYGMNGKNLPIQHGAPVRMRVETQIGYKSMKFLNKIVVTDEFSEFGDPNWSWFTGI
ncbi:DMSO/TMAO reductase YedYZ molybdopterin-dependent catalytic subunit [Algoriphagus boseongensis]|uniref:DMSO/TMAO reductase YedYZ molybdopterin-dependent catalytic subunit n=1 Tax=Algoriphagus boseongensis TaxID=1442587 RepID=A0A4V3D234_9BACT|nr:molybdopterin-dependent oxidoreductase [Algoriphagus boseongensis]TDQ16673.1 DMSO/TMAO reductase YedYZ molybdopterin-dependent catalytic subunit [Algoriphagus boseongensis]